MSLDGHPEAVLERFAVKRGLAVLKPKPKVFPFRDVGKPLFGPTRSISVGCDGGRFIFPEELATRIFWGGSLKPLNTL